MKHPPTRSLALAGIAVALLVCGRSTAATSPATASTAPIAAKPAPSLVPTSAPESYHSGAPDPSPPMLTASTVPRIDVNATKALVDAGKAVIVDVRDDGSWQVGHIAGAVHITGIELEEHLENHRSQLGQNQRLITYCS